MKVDKGILLVATGKQTYGKYVYNLALSLKTESPDIPIALIYEEETINFSLENGESFTDYLSPLIDKFILPKEEDLYPDGIFKPSRFKTFLHDYSPFLRTIFIDADSIWFPGKKVEWLFYELEDVQFASCDYELYKLSEIGKNGKLFTWAYIKDIENYLNNNNEYISQIHSQILYFEKQGDNENNDKLFKEARNTYDKLSLDKDVVNDLWHGQVPDELCFSIASNITNIHHYGIKWKPLLCVIFPQFENFNSSLMLYYITNFWGMTIPFNKLNSNESAIKFYNWVMDYFNMINKYRYHFFPFDEDKFNKDDNNKNIEQTSDF